QQGRGPRGRRRLVLAAAGGRPVQACRGVAAVGGVVEVGGAQLAPGVLGLLPEGGVGGEDEDRALRVPYGLCGRRVAGVGRAVVDGAPGAGGVPAVDRCGCRRGRGRHRLGGFGGRQDGGRRRGFRLGCSRGGHLVQGRRLG